MKLFDNSIRHVQLQIWLGRLLGGSPKPRLIIQALQYKYVKILAQHVLVNVLSNPQEELAFIEHLLNTMKCYKHFSHTH